MAFIKENMSCGRLAWYNISVKPINNWKRPTHVTAAVVAADLRVEESVDVLG
jgi:hypothetical protein